MEKYQILDEKSLDELDKKLTFKGSDFDYGVENLFNLVFGDLNIKYGTYIGDDLKDFRVLKMVVGMDYDLQKILKYPKFEFTKNLALQEFILKVLKKDIEKKDDMFYTRRALKQENKIYFCRILKYWKTTSYIFYDSTYPLYNLRYCELEIIN